MAYDCVRFVVVRAGSARLFSEFGTCHVNAGDVIVLAANMICGAEPESWVTTTTLYLDRDYIVDQVFWQYASHFNDRRDASEFLNTAYPEPAQIVTIDKDHAERLMLGLDELSSLSADGIHARDFYRAQALLSVFLDVVVPRLAVTGQWIASTQRSTGVPAPPRHRRFRPLRAEAQTVADLLASNLNRRWTVSELAESVHLSQSHLRRVFTDAFGKSPIAYLTMLRAERMAHLLKATDSPVSVIAGLVGWGDPDFAARQFRRCVGVAPSEYRRLSR